MTFQQATGGIPRKATVKDAPHDNITIIAFIVIWRLVVRYTKMHVTNSPIIASASLKHFPMWKS
ncbi:hypothetical protein O9929_12405 [Vibrio lentus]|nr:hypothetical protein [Vibrio lentus]